MKRDIREFLPPLQTDLDQLQTLIEVHGGTPVDEAHFARLMAGVAAVQARVALADGSSAAASLAALAKSLCTAQSVSQTGIAKVLGISALAWRNVLSGKVAPYRVPAEAYARLASRFHLSFSALEAAISGTHALHAQSMVRGSLNFAKSHRSARAKPTYDQQLTSAFAELRLKTHAVRAVSGQDAVLTEFLGKLRQCMI